MIMDRLPIAVVGLNFGRAICNELERAPANQWFRLAAVCDLDPAKAQAEANARGVACYTDLEALLADPSIRTIGLFTGPNGRAALLAKILAAGKDVMTTKPFERDPAQAAAVVAEARRLGRVLHANSPSPSAPDLQVIRAWMARHDLGRPVAARAEVWGSYREQADGSWYDDPVRCPVPPIYRLGIYLINDIIALLGTPAAVAVQSSRIFTGRPTADHAQLAIRFADGGLGQVFASLCIGDGDQYRQGLVVHCDRGTIYRNIGPERGAQRGELSLVKQVGGVRTVVERATLDTVSGEYEWAAFHRACTGGGDPGLDPVVVAGGLKVIEAMATAERERREVELA
jgi:predicted dehydrogenase